MPNRVKASMHPYFTSNGVDDDLLNWTTPFIPVWNDWIMLRSFWRHPVLVRTLKRLSWLIRSKVYECNAEWPLLFSAFLLKNIMSIVECSDLMSYCDSEYTLSASFLSLFRTMWANAFPMMLSKVILLCSCTGWEFYSLQCPWEIPPPLSADRAVCADVQGVVPLQSWYFSCGRAIYGFTELLQALVTG